VSCGIVLAFSSVSAFRVRRTCNTREAPMPNVRAPVFFDFRSPLSGSVSQLIEPWRWSMDGNNNRYSLFSIDLGNSGAPALENEIVSEVGYGRQLGRISEALEVLVKR